MIYEARNGGKLWVAQQQCRLICASRVVREITVLFSRSGNTITITPEPGRRLAGLSAEYFLSGTLIGYKFDD